MQSVQNPKPKFQNQSQKLKSPLKARCTRFSIQLLSFIDSLPNQKSLWSISDQLLRGGTSIGANVSEASGSTSKQEFKKYFEIALKSANETIYWLNLLNETKKFDTASIQPLLDEVTQIARILGASVITMKESARARQL